MMRALVLATNRPEAAVNFFTAWDKVSSWDRALLIHDGPEPIDAKFPDFVTQYCWQDIPSELGKLISRRDSAIKSFGFYLAKTLGFDEIHVLDDDCLPCFAQNVAAIHSQNLQGFLPVWESSIPGMRVRGLPYENTVRQRHDVGVSLGLWDGIPDLDAVQSFNHMQEDFTPARGTRVVAKGVQVPFCGMNFAFKASLVPAMYFPLMGQGQPFGRWDDIWGGLVVKKALDDNGLMMTVGEPHVYHSRMSNKYSNLMKEATSITAHEHFWELVQFATPGTSLEDSVARIAATLRHEAANFPLEQFRSYVYNYGECLDKWVLLTSK